MRLQTTLPALLLLATLAACGRSGPTPQTMDADAPTAGAVSVRDTPAFDPSLPAADKALAPPTMAGGRDDKRSAPLGTLTRAEESEAMPKAGQANTHSSPSLDAASAAR